MEGSHSCPVVREKSLLHYLNNIDATDKPSEHALIEYYTSDLGPDLAMFVKISVRPTLVDTYEEAKKVEVEMESIDHYPV